MSDEDKKKAETKAKLRAFLQGGGSSDDVQSVLVHTLMHHAEDRAEKAEKAKPATKPKKK